MVCLKVHLLSGRHCQVLAHIFDAVEEVMERSAAEFELDNFEPGSARLTCDNQVLTSLKGLEPQVTHHLVLVLMQRP